MKKQLDLTEGNICKVLTAFLLPMILGSLIQQLYTTADAVIVGQFAGKTGLAAIDSVHTLFKFPLNFMSGLSAGATILISGFYGSKDQKSLHCCVRTANTLALILGILCSIVGVILTPQLLHIMIVPEDIYPQTLAYCRIYFGGIWSLILYNMNAGILRAFGDSKRPLYILVLSSFFNFAGFFLGQIKNQNFVRKIIPSVLFNGIKEFRLAIISKTVSPSFYRIYSGNSDVRLAIYFICVFVDNVPSHNFRYLFRRLANAFCQPIGAPFASVALVYE